MTATLTERYIDAVTRALPAAQRADVATELRGSVADQIDGSVASGRDPASAEIAVLNGLGDPTVLAAGYADRPQHLVGPRWYPSWLRVLKVVLWSSLPFVALGVIIAMALEERPLWGIVGPTIGITLSVGAWIFTIMTIVYAAIDRSGDAAEPWTVEYLPLREPAGTRPLGRGEKVVAVLALLFAVAGLVFVTVPWPVDGAGRLAVVDPVLWPWSLVFGIVLIVAGVLVDLRARTARRWGNGSAIATTVLALAWTAPIVILAVTGRLFDPAFVAFLGIDRDAQIVITTCVVAAALAIAGWSAFDAFRRRDRRPSLGA